MIAMLVGGIVALVKGEIALSKTKTVTGAKARIIGGIFILPLPLTVVLGFAYGIYLAGTGQQIDEESTALMVISFAPFLLCALLGIALGFVWAD